MINLLIDARHAREQLDAKTREQASASVVANLRMRAAAADAQVAEGWRKVTAAELAYDTQRDLLYVYGSDEAGSKETPIGISIQNSDILILNRGGRDTRAWSGEFGEEDLHNFQIIFCREVSATPRRSCT